MPADPAPLTAAEVAELAAKVEAMTPGPWHQFHFPDPSPPCDDYGSIYYHVPGCANLRNADSSDDAAGIVALRNAAPRLLATVTARDTRIQELLALVAKLSNTVPFAEEVEGWEAQRRAMIAEVGTLRARVGELEARLDGLPETVTGRMACEILAESNRRETEAVCRLDESEVRAFRAERRVRELEAGLSIAVSNLTSARAANRTRQPLAIAADKEQEDRLRALLDPTAPKEPT